MVRYCPHILSLTVNRCDNITKSIELVARSYPNLVSINVRDTDVTDATIKTIASMCPELKYLCNNDCIFLTDDPELAVAHGYYYS